MGLPVITLLPAGSAWVNQTTILPQALQTAHPNRMSSASVNMEIPDHPTKSTTPTIAFELTTPHTSPINPPALVKSTTPHTTSTTPPTTPEQPSLPGPSTPPEQIITPNTTTPPPAPKKPNRGVIPFSPNETMLRHNNNIPLLDLSNRLHRAHEEENRLRKELAEKYAANPVMKHAYTAAKDNENETAEKGYLADTEEGDLKKKGRGGKGKGSGKTSSQDPAAEKAPVVVDVGSAAKVPIHHKDLAKNNSVVVAVHSAKETEKADKKEQPAKKDQVTKTFWRHRARGGAKRGASVLVKEEEVEYDGDAE